ncbi:hypothetical protein E4O03_02835 [Treponema sp. OMZ 792]|uniref:hypothetical protein n=1 Tax=unclassified Treponema TaxID=2638727 RepID=UPI0020A51A0C|nr:MULTISPECIES: hypothetical protein [unclassified Treponema]UTC67577.1 hypothetical protein E4O06_02585 [Treponema sp. OMZ 789]UTC70304.1 hypothetical protein E4O01_02575 [Treponema sp. OMZ 790]UTC73019.1 hypothetical protein E4O02_02575 [Treponema sp. OMZ 791]UTC75678.1 hypothetical protein E4O03_02835 [Treponema sp. OMZ 792]UTC76484.1 hypothetical protein E4O04_11115 [Treponema sp. OMZ 799]
MKKNIVSFLFIIITVFVIHCEELSYINYANNYNISEYDIKNILGTYMEKN